MKKSRQDFFDRPKNIKILLRCFYILCSLLFFLEFIIHRHALHPWESLIGFYPLYGFIGCVMLVLIAKWLRTFLMREQEYYEPLESHLNLKGDKDDVVE